MVVIRLARGGAKKRPFYHIVVADPRFPRDGRFIEKLGYYNPVAAAHETALKVNMARFKDWVKRGACASQRVRALIDQLAATEAARA